VCDGLVDGISVVCGCLISVLSVCEWVLCLVRSGVQSAEWVLCL